MWYDLPGQPNMPAARKWLLATVVGLVGVAAYLPQCKYEFVYDDESIISRNPTVRGGEWASCLTRPYWPRKLSTDPLYRPVTTLSLRLNYALFGDGPFGYRVTNACLHGLCCALVALLAVRLWRRRAAGWVAGLLFATHPLHAEAVAMVVGRAELLAAALSIGLIYRHLGYLSGPRTVSVRYHLISTLLLLLAVGSKEHAVLTLPAIVCLDVWARRAADGAAGSRTRISHLAASHYLGLVLAIAAFLFTRWLMFGGRTTLPPDQVNAFANPLVGASAATRLATPPALLWLSLRLFAVPIGMCPIWSIGGFDVPQTFWRADVLAGAVLAVAMIVVVIKGLRHRRRSAPPIALAGLFLLLPCHFVPAANWLFAERWIYLPSAFAVLLIAGLLPASLGRFRAWCSGLRLAGRSAGEDAGRCRTVPPKTVSAKSPFAAPVFMAAALALFAMTHQYQRCWQNTDKLFESVVARHPYSYHGLTGYAQGLRLRGQLTEGQTQVARLVERFPDSSRTWYYQALLMDRLRKPQEVIEAVDKFVRLTAPNPIPADLREARNRARRLLERGGPPTQPGASPTRSDATRGCGQRWIVSSSVVVVTAT